MQTILLAVLSSIGAAAVLWLLFGFLLLPVGRENSVRVVLMAQENAADIEHILRGLHWLRAAGLLNAEIEIVDAGLDETGRERVRRLCGGSGAEAVPTVREKGR